MPLCVIFSVVQSGDVGGQGISRFVCQNSAGTSMSNTELNACAAAIAGLYTTAKPYLPNSMSFAVQNVAQVVDEQTGALAMVQNIPTVTSVAGTASSSYVAGTGARMYWHTVTVKNRRLVRGATYMTPLSSPQFTAQGTISPTITATLATAGATYIAAITTANCTPMVWCRPKPLSAGNGLAANIVACSVTTKAASLRSRRS